VRRGFGRAKAASVGQFRQLANGAFRRIPKNRKFPCAVGQITDYGLSWQMSGASMPDAPSELVEISKLNGDFKRNYGKLIGAFLYLRSVSAARERPFFWGALFALASAGLDWLRHSIN
jgi:hypothetical protein